MCLCALHRVRCVTDTDDDGRTRRVKHDPGRALRRVTNSPARVAARSFFNRPWPSASARPMRASSSSVSSSCGRSAHFPSVAYSTEDVPSAPSGAMSKPACRVRPPPLQKLAPRSNALPDAFPSPSGAPPRVDERERRDARGALAAWRQRREVRPAPVHAPLITIRTRGPAAVHWDVARRKQRADEVVARLEGGNERVFERHRRSVVPGLSVSSLFGLHEARRGHGDEQVVSRTEFVRVRGQLRAQRALQHAAAASTPFCNRATPR